MANYHCSIYPIRRSKGESVASRVNYITGVNINDCYSGKPYYQHRKDAPWWDILLPAFAPQEYRQLQNLTDAMNNAEHRKDARTAREMKGSLPNELNFEEQVRITIEFIESELLSRGLCAVAAIHIKENENNPSHNNPHCHIVFSTRTLNIDGFCVNKDPWLNSRDFLLKCRYAWEKVQNRAYERSGLAIRVDCRSLSEQGIDREPINHLTWLDWQLEQRDQRTKAGDLRREIKARNKDRERHIVMHNNMDRAIARTLVESREYLP